jgi:hypothetical protein
VTPGSPDLARAATAAGWTLCALWLPAVLCLRSRRAPTSPWAQGLLRFLGIWAPVAAANWLVETVCNHFGTAAPPAQDVLRDFADGTLARRIAIAVCAIIVMPPVEEWVFRGHLQTWLLRRLPPVQAIALVALVFASLHLSLRALLPIAILSVGLSLARLRTGRLLPCIVMHSLYNASSLAFLLALGPNALAP